MKRMENQMTNLEKRMDARIKSDQEMADHVVMFLFCLAIIKIVVHDGTTVNVTERRCQGTRCLLLITTHNIQVALKHDSKPYHRRHIRAE